MGQWAKAAADYARILELEPQNDGARLKLASCSVHLGRYQQALDDYGQIVERFPKSALPHNDLAWLLATCPEAAVRDPSRALELAKKAAEIAPKEGTHWNTLGVAHYRLGEWKASIEALTKSMELRAGGDSFDWFFLAMAHWQLDEQDQARQSFDQAVAWMEKNAKDNAELIRFRDEATELMKDNR